MTNRIYEADGLQVLWDSRRCVHVAACIRALPVVFNPLARPWVRMQNGTTEQIIAPVEHCSTGALRYMREDGTFEVPPAATTIAPIPDGPLVMSADLHVVSPSGDVVTRETRLAFCRCMDSANQRYCDNSHRPNRRHSASRRGPSAPLDGIPPPLWASIARPV